MSETFRGDGTERDAGLTAIYRAAAGEEPPRALDDAIRAAARRAVSSRPQRVSSPFIRSWRVPLSIAAVMLLTVSLVMVMREEAPEAMSPPGSVRPLGATDSQWAGPAADAGDSATAVPKTFAPRAQRSDSVGLKPPARTLPSGIGLRDNRISPDPASQPHKDMAAAEAVTSILVPAPVAAMVPAVTAGAAAEGKVLPPDQWLERIEELRRQSKFGEARKSLTEFRKRYPDYELPASVKNWAEP